NNCVSDPYKSPQSDAFQALTRCLPCAHSRPFGVFERPAAAQGFVKLNDRNAAPGLDLRKRVLRRKELLLSLENLVIARFAFLVAVGRYRHSLSTGTDGLGLLNALCLEPAVGDERIGYLTEGA